mmetsp:Transcript_12269/g.25320  ORF Transcript_12269/g.25320 Transcript_12269/m.25320 type:complete len:120 (-) Transcript_12269:37-396(-)
MVIVGWNISHASLFQCDGMKGHNIRNNGNHTYASQKTTENDSTGESFRGVALFEFSSYPHSFTEKSIEMLLRPQQRIYSQSLPYNTKYDPPQECGDGGLFRISEKLKTFCDGNEGTAQK